MVWTYLFLIGLDGGLSEQSVANALMVSQFFGIAGAATAVILSNKPSRSLALGMGISASIASLSAMHSQLSFWVYAAATGLFTYAWNFVHPYLLATMVDIDKSGKTLIWAIFMQTAGIAIAPSLAAFFMEGDYLLVNWMGGSLFAISLILILPVTMRSNSVAPAVEVS